VQKRTEEKREDEGKGCCSVRMVMLLKASPARVIALAPHRSLVLLLTRSASTNSSAQNAPFAHPTSSTAPTVRARGIEAVIKYGPGGRSSVSGVLATVFGSTGFLGRYVVNRLAKLGSQVLLPYRGDEYDWRHMKLMGDLGQVNATYYNPRSLKEVSKMVEYSNVVINLIGRDFETSNFTYYDVHVTIPSLIAKAAKQAGVSRFIHVSCLGAAEDSPSPSYRQSGKENRQFCLLSLRQLLFAQLQYLDMRIDFSIVLLGYTLTNLFMETQWCAVAPQNTIQSMLVMWRKALIK